MARRLTKGPDKKIFGVCSGLGEYFDIDPTIVRVIFVFGFLVFGSGLLLLSHFGNCNAGSIGCLSRQCSDVFLASFTERLPHKDFKSELLISKEVFDQINGDGSIKGESLGDIMLKGESKPMEIIKIR